MVKMIMGAFAVPQYGIKWKPSQIFTQKVCAFGQNLF